MHLHLPPRVPIRVDLLIFLHGVGSSGGDLIPLARDWAGRTGLAVAAPDAPFPFDLAAVGRQWFSVAGVTDENRPRRLDEASAAFDAVLEREMQVAGTSETHTALIGFSQGTIMALDALGRGRHFAGVLGFSGRLGRPPKATIDRRPVLLVHGDADPVIPVDEAMAARHALEAAGAVADFARIAGGGHGIGPEAATVGFGFLQRLVAGEEN